MKGSLLVSLDLAYLQTEYIPLLKLKIGNPINMGEGKFRWFFKARDLNKVIAVLGKQVELDKEDVIEVNKYIEQIGQIKEDKSRKKGQGKFEIVFRAPKLFIIETIINEKLVRKKVPVENVKVAWEVIKKYPLNLSVKSRTVAERIIERLGITRFNRLESKVYDWEKFFGCRAEYYNYFYAPIKILESDGVIIHHKIGEVERIKEEWDMQTETR